MENMVGQAQTAQVPNTVQVPNYSGVNIQIFNPSVAAPGAAAPASTINAPTYSTNPSYPANYYTQNLAQPAQTQIQPVQPVQPQAVGAEKKKTETREIVQLTDDYIKNLENYLNSQDKEVRLIGAKEILARLQEDDSRKNDKALNALVNKMLQDPYQPIRFMAMAMLESRDAAGNETSINLLKNIQQRKTNDGQDALKASNVLLKISAPTTKKEFEVKNTSKNKGGKE